MKNLIIVAGVVILLVIFSPLRNINWGKIQWMPGQTITVLGEAKLKQKNQIATFNAGVNSVNDDKDTAVKEVNDKVTKLVAAIKEFGISEEDIKTQNMSVYQNEETYWDNGVQKSRLGQWRVNSSVDITLRSVDKANGLSDLLAKSGANNVYGPTFGYDDSSAMEKELFDAAIVSANKKAEIVAKSTGRKVGKVINITEGYDTSAVYSKYDGMGGGGADLQPGTSVVNKVVTVVYELK